MYYYPLAIAIDEIVFDNIDKFTGFAFWIDYKVDDEDRKSPDNVVIAAATNVSIVRKFTTSLFAIAVKDVYISVFPKFKVPPLLPNIY